MKEKIYTVTVTGSIVDVYRIAAKSAPLAEREAERRFQSKRYKGVFDRIESYAVADWRKKERRGEN